MNMITPIAQVDPERLEAFAGKVAADVACALGVLLSHMGDETGLYATLRDIGPCSAAELASAAQVDERYLLEWLSAQAASGYVEYDAGKDRFSLTPEQAVVFADDSHPACVQGIVQLAVSQFARHEKALDVFRTGAGRPWGEHHSCLFCGTDRFFRTGYGAFLIEGWLPALEGVTDRLRAGARVADVGCGHGSSTLLMAKAFPKSIFHGVDVHGPSIEAARAKAEEAGAGANTRFVTGGAGDYAEKDLDLVCVFDALHDMGDPVGVARHIRQSLKPDGTLMLVEPMAGDSLADNLHVIGKLYYSASTLICTPAARSQAPGFALGAQAGQKRLTKVLNDAGFTRVRRVAESPTNMVLEARP
jgi:2-polyprenyl-3-methyl-5-hydroxy-6-metoxy-1,4-benzoquinol methylase